MAASPSRRQRRLRALLIAAAVLVLGRVLDTQSITALRSANQGVRQALDALDPFVAARDFYDRLGSCSYDWRFRCLCRVARYPWLPAPRAAGCLRSEPRWPFNWINNIQFWLFYVVAKVPGIPDAMLYAARRIATKGAFAVGLGLVTAAATALIVLGAVEDTLRKTPNASDVFGMVVAILLIPVLTGLLAFLLKALFLIVTWVFGVTLSVLVYAVSLIGLAREALSFFETARAVETTEGRVRRWWRMKGRQAGTGTPPSG